jgi:AAA domain-containing protein
VRAPREFLEDVTLVRPRERFESVDVSTFEKPEEWRPLPLPQAAAATAAASLDHGRGLIYGGGAIVLVSSEPGVGKSMVLAAFLADEATAGRTVLYLDFERTPELLLERMRSAGLTDDELLRVHYLRPRSPASAEWIVAMIERLDPKLVALDSYDAALAHYGYETTNEDVRIFAAAVIEPLRSRGASILIADHVPKDREKRGRYSIGGQAKLALAEAHLGLVPIAALRRGSEGKLRVRTLKDTFGYLPPSAVFTLRSHAISGALSWDVSADDDAEAGEDFRPTGLMERVSRELERRGEFVSRTEVVSAVKGKAKFVRQAIDCLVREEFAEETDGLRGARLVRSLRTFREDDE